MRVLLQNRMMVEKKSRQCLDVDDETKRLILRSCDGSTRQQWRWQHHYDREGNRL